MTTSGSVHQDALKLVGMPEEQIELYWRCLAVNGGPLEMVIEALGTTREELDALMVGLPWPDTLWIEDDNLHVLSPDRALARFLEGQAQAAAEINDALVSMARAMPAMVSHLPAAVSHREALDGQVFAPPQVEILLDQWYEDAAIDIMQCHGNEWTSAGREVECDRLATATARGVWCRGIYPAVAALAAPALLRARRDQGEEIRILPDVVQKLLVIDGQVALRVSTGGALNRIVVSREPALHEALAAWFETLWVRAVPLEDHDTLSLTRHQGRTDLLQRLVAGEKDEQIARGLDMSVRSVRRRVAELMLELGADSRFQAGAEAARRGWL